MVPDETRTVTPAQTVAPRSETDLEAALSWPTAGVIEVLARLEGDILVLGAGWQDGLEPRLHGSAGAAGGRRGRPAGLLSRSPASMRGRGSSSMTLASRPSAQICSMTVRSTRCRMSTTSCIWPG